MRTHRFFRWLMLLALVATATLSGPARTVRAETSPDAVIHWNGIAVTAVIDILPRHAPAHAAITMSYVQAAVYNAVVAIEGRYAPYHSTLSRQSDASLEAAVAAATLDVLVNYLPAAKHAALIDQYNAYVGALPPGDAKEAGLALGHAAAAEIIALRQGDGYQANIPFVQPPIGPGVWVPAGGPATALTPWVGQMRPFLMSSAGQFNPGPPPNLSSGKYAQDYNEVKSIGAANSTVRTPAQTEAARFWTEQPGWQFNMAYRSLVLAHDLNAVEAARVYAMGNLVAADAGIACWQAKYQYNFWRPEPAIRQGATDGNPSTMGDPTWVPLVGTPPHPEYPSGHGCVTTSQAQVFAALFGGKHINVDIMSRTVPGAPLTTRHFTTADDLRQEIIDVRVWSGIHFRTSDEIGAKMGLRLVHWALQQYFRPVAGN